MSSDADSVIDVGAVDELRFLGDLLRRVDAAAAAADWDGERAMTRVVDEAQAELTAARDAVGDVAAAGASTTWVTRAQDYALGSAQTQNVVPAPAQAGANVVVAVALARAAVAEAILAVAQARNLDVAHASGKPTRRIAVLRVAPVAGVGRRILDEIRHVVVDTPRAILLRLVITLAVSVSLVAFLHVSGWSKYDDIGQLTLYLFSAVVGSVVCTNALCFEAQRVRDGISDGERMWRIMVSKNLAMLALVTIAGLPVIGLLTVTNGVNPIALIDQLVTMVFIWLGVGNVLSVLYPLRHEPISARLRDGTWKPYLFSFALSYGVGLTVNLMIFWRLWSRQTASTELVGGEWAAFALVLLSAMTSWILLTVFAIACSREPRIRRVLSREMVAYRRPDAP